MTCLPVEHVELEEVVRQRVVEDRVPGVEPLAEHDVAAAERLPQLTLNGAGPSLQQPEVARARPAVEEVAAALEQQPAVLAEADGGVRAVQLLLDHDA